MTVQFKRQTACQALTELNSSHNVRNPPGQCLWLGGFLGACFVSSSALYSIPTDGGGEHVLVRLLQVLPSVLEWSQSSTPLWIYS